MKKKFLKKLNLNKKTITRLQNEEMRLIKGASIFIPSCDCDTDSCSIPVRCCNIKTIEMLLKDDKV
jgi:natural product precursor